MVYSTEHESSHGYHGYGPGCGGKGHHKCPVCGMPHGGESGYGRETGRGHGHLAKKAVKKLLLEKVKARIDARWGDKLDEIAEELVDMAEEKMKLKKDMWKRKQAVKEHLLEIWAGEAEGEE